MTPEHPDHPSLFDPPIAETAGRHRVGDPQTSVDAARSVDASRLADAVHRALATCRDHGATAYDLMRMLNGEGIPIQQNSVSTRLKSLEDCGRVRRTDVRRAGSTHRNLIVWIAT